MKEYRDCSKLILIPGVCATPKALYFESIKKERYLLRLLFDETVKRKLDPFFILNQFCVSDMANFIVNKSIRGFTYSINTVIDEIVSKFDLAHIDYTVDPVILHWIADVFITARDNYSYSEIIQKLPPDYLYDHYNPLHETSEANAIDRVLKAHLTNDVTCIFINGVWYSQMQDVPNCYKELLESDDFLKKMVYKNGVIDMKRVFFHLPEEENGYLSNWYLSSFAVGNIEFSSMEQFLMYQKAILFNDTDIAQKILQTDNPAEIKKLGRKVNGFKESIWAANRFQICMEGLQAKFNQNKELQEKLLHTSGRFAECAVHDHIWGIGCSMNDPNRFVCSNWNGMNLLGAALGQLYNELKVS